MSRPTTTQIERLQHLAIGLEQQLDTALAQIAAYEAEGQRIGAAVNETAEEYARVIALADSTPKRKKKLTARRRSDAYRAWCEYQGAVKVWGRL